MSTKPIYLPDASKQISQLLLDEAKFLLQQKDAKKTLPTAQLFLDKAKYVTENKSSITKKDLKDISNELLGLTETIQTERMYDLALNVARITTNIKKTPEQKMQANVQRARNEMSKSGRKFPGYPFTPQEKDKYKDQRALINNMEFSNSSKLQVHCPIVALNCGKAHVALAQGKRDYMEDRCIAETIHFKGDTTYAADLYTVCDGHGGQRAVNFVTSQLPGYLKSSLEEELKGQKPNPDAIFYAIKRAIFLAHQRIIEQKIVDGTTLVLAFRIKGDKKLYVANVGDSSAFINRNGQALPLSIEQKPSFYVIPGSETVAFDKPNKYAKELIKHEVKIHNDSKIQQEFEDFEAQKAMVMSYTYRVGDKDNYKLGNAKDFHLDMARSLGDREFSKWMKSGVAEFFSIELLPGDQLVMHSDGVGEDPITVASAIENDKKMGVSSVETAACIVQASVPRGDNTTAMIVDFYKEDKPSAVPEVKASTPSTAPVLHLAVQYDAGFGHKLTIRGVNAKGLSWEKDVDLRWTPGNKWVVDLEPTGKEVFFKILLDGKTWEQKQGNRAFKAGEEVVLISDIRF